MKPIQYYSKGYQILRFYTLFFLRNFYKKTTVKGLKNIPKNKAVILALNHQNALMDAINVLACIKQQPVFMARADIFKKKRTAKFLRWIKILPIYRIRDGVKNLQNNEQIFDEAIGVLEDKKILAILPEGTHGDQRKLRTLKKGIARIAFKAEEKNNFNLDIKIIPIGLDYSEYIHVGGKLLVNIGKAFDLKPYIEEYLQDEQKAMANFMKDLRGKMLEQMLHIEEKENYESFFALSNLYIESLKPKKINHFEELKIKQEFIEKVDKIKTNDLNIFTKITEQTSQINQLIRKLNLRIWILEKTTYDWKKNFASIMFLLLFFPLFFIGFVSNILPFHLPVYLSKNVKDPQFLSSFRFVFALLSFSLFYLLYAIFLLLIINNLLLALSLTFAIPILGIFGFNYFIKLKKIRAKLKVNKLYRQKNKDYLNLVKIWNELKFFLDKL